MQKKYVVVGGVAGGMSAAARIRRLDPFADVKVFEKGPHVSFSNCCLPYHLAGIVPEAENLVLMQPEELKNQYNLDVHTQSEVTAIDRKKKTITVKDLSKGTEYEETYDTLVLSPGAHPVVPKSIVGVDSKHVFTVRNVTDIDRLQRYLVEKNVDSVAVIGGGFIGLEVMESLREAGRTVTLVEGAAQVMQPLDFDLVQLVHKEIIDHGVTLHLNENLTEVHDDHIVLSSGKTVACQAVVLCIGVRPATELAVAAGLEIGATGGILVDANYKTSDPDILAIGDAIEVTNRITLHKTRLALAGPAQRQARAAADGLFGRPHTNTGVVGSSVVKVFDQYISTTGLNEKQCKAEHIDYEIAYVIPKDRVGLMPNWYAVHYKLVFQVPTGKILGVQAVGKGPVDKYVNVAAALIMKDGTVDDLKEIELAYCPWVNTAKDAGNMAGLVASNLLNGDFEQVHIDEVRDLVEQGAFIIDAREAWEYEEGHLVGAINIPLSTFRDRLDEIPKDRPVYVHCLSAQRSYYMVRELVLRGYTNVKNISGSYLAICEHEYFRDVTENRKPIVTNYRFNLLG